MLDILFTKSAGLHSNQLRDVGVKDGKITYIADSSEAAPESIEVYDLAGKLLLPGLVEPHIHLDKALLLERMAEDVTELRRAIEVTSRLKQSFTAEDIYERSMRVIRQAVSKGITHMRCHAEIDPVIGLTSMEAMVALRQQLQGIIDLQVVAFPQDGLFHDERMLSLMQQAAALGPDVIGGITYMDTDLSDHLAYVFEMAEQRGLPVDLHVDFSDNPQQLAIKQVIEATKHYGMQGKVSVGHLTSLGAADREDAKRIAADIAEAGIHVISLPLTDLYLNGRGEFKGDYRGLTPISTLLEHGVNVTYGSNNVQNAFTPFGTTDPLDVGLLLAQTSHLGSAKDAMQLLRMATLGAADALGLTEYGLRIGADADLIVCAAKDARSLLYERPERERVYKRGRLVSQTEVKQHNWLSMETVG
ncbi:N-acyl-D-amino-acid deacylase [Paenibacillus glycanilyticus]|uniref:N-acyl-D-amino-acid deacylase n=2 Tax=Paenibacillus glycanilyticus TaxID=126569 RepID=A0ABQ6G8C6_9BACL|nr:N-acyl-D-amino-acid deacylase [Paenibacillus glycanilyticus]